MEKGQKTTEPQQNNETIQNPATPPEVDGDKPEENTIDTHQNDGDGMPPKEKGDRDINGIDPKEEEQPTEEKHENEEPQAEEVSEGKKDANLEEGKGEGEKTDEIIKKLKDHKCTLDCDKCCNCIKYLFLILLCLGGVTVLTLVMFGVLGVQLNVYSKMLIYGLMLLLIAAIVVLSYMFTTSNRRYSAAINRLDLLITRIGLMDNKSKLFMDVDRELQLIARLLESSNNKVINL